MSEITQQPEENEVVKRGNKENTLTSWLNELKGKTCGKNLDSVFYKIFLTLIPSYTVDLFLCVFLYQTRHGKWQTNIKMFTVPLYTLHKEKKEQERCLQCSLENYVCIPRERYLFCVQLCNNEQL